jgi:luciferase-type oxidoreductase
MWKFIMKKEIEPINKTFNKVFRYNQLSVGIMLPIESYPGAIPTMDKHIEMAKMAEDVGFSSLWLRDVPLLDPAFGDGGQLFDPWTYLGFLAATTKSIALGTSSIVCPLRHPIHIAKAAFSLDILSNQRFIMGVASGDRPIEYPAFAKNIEDRYDVFRMGFEYFNSLSNEYPTYSDQLGTINGNANLLPKPLSIKIPKLVTGYSGQTIEWIATHSDGWLYYPCSLTYQESMIKTWHDTLQNIDAPFIKPFAQSLYIDLVADEDYKPQSIHLGYKLGVNWLTEILNSLRELHVNHVIINLKYGQRPAEQVLEELGRRVIPHFH